ncbi:MAG: three-Cys-motif partner protein TcmP [Gemmatimonadaceae bacterium]|nr:three-Cys-motif partner protein TcmP [Caulobacter sp.]
MAIEDDVSAEHYFGGAWTEVKLDAISEYLQFYTSALKSSKFSLWYVDAFAGSGERTATVERGGIFDGSPLRWEHVQLDGSAKRALAIEPAFSAYIFIEQDTGRFASLTKLSTEHADREIVCKPAEANAALAEVFLSPPWSGQRQGNGPLRAVVFLDPYGMSVKWKTLEMLAKTAAVDVWYLFPLNAVVRQLAKKYEAIDAAKQAKLDEIFGCNDWRTALYETDVKRDLFDEISEKTTRAANQRQIETYAAQRLRTVFSYVSDPVPLLTDRGAQLFSLFCMSHGGPRAQALIQKGVNHVLKKYAPASRQRFAL